MQPQTFTLTDADLSFATDLYQLTMAAAYQRFDEMPDASFELFVRRLPKDRNFLVLAGLEQALATVSKLRFSHRQLDYLRELPQFADVGDGFWQELADFRFSGDIEAMPEGTVFFPNEPVLRVTGPLFEAQLLETVLLSILNFQTAVASKAARVRLAAGPEALLAEFGSRRAHGPQAAAWAARAAYLAGFDATSNVLAGQQLGIPITGTMAHSFVMAFEDEAEAFRQYQATFPQHTIHLVDTYDSLRGVQRALEVGGKDFLGVRLDSGDLCSLAQAARQLLDDGGRPDAKIFASNNIDEWRIAELRAGGAPIDAYGVGTRVAVPADAPTLDGVYKLVQSVHAGQTRLHFKASAHKVSYPGCKQVLRRFDEQGRLAGDLVLLCDDLRDGSLGESLLQPVMRQGELLPLPGLEASKTYCQNQLASLPDALCQLEESSEPYAVRIDQRLEQLLGELKQRRDAGL